MTSAHLQIYNPIPDTSQSFPNFARLPQELRLYIWSLSLRHERFLHIELHPPSEGSDLKYSILVKECKILSKLLRVNVESRQAAQSFYRVRLPCQYAGGPDGMQPVDGTFYFHPELDILWVSPRLLTGHEAFIPFLSDLRKNDPRKIGLQNLGMQESGIRRLEGIQTPRLSAEDHETLKSTLSGLRNMYYLSIQYEGRVHLGHFSGIQAIKDFEVHRSKPIMPLTPSFTRLPSDPRPDIERDLSKVYVGLHDPRCMVFQWRKLLQRWRVTQHKSQTKHHFFLSHRRPAREYVTSRETAEAWLETEHQSWLKGQERFRGVIEKKGLSVPIESEEELMSATKTAVGFWVFDVTALGKFPKVDEDYQWDAGYWKSQRVLDLREHRPQLCLAKIP